MGDIYTKDMKTILTNWVVAVLIGGLIFLPSLYAWLNIKAAWDPYGQTDEIPIGVVNEDEGTTVRGKDIDVGEMIEDTLEDNSDMNWQFVSRDEATQEVEYGNYFASIVIPSDFSEQLGSVVSDHPEKAEINYYVNEKINAIAPKITDKGVSVIVDEVSSEFISTVNGAIFDMFNDIGLELEEDQPDIEKFEEYILTLEEELPNIHDTLTETNEDGKEAKKIVHKAMDKIPEVKSMTHEGSDVLDKTMGHLDQAEDLFDELSPKISDDLSTAQVVIHEINEVIEYADENDGIQDRLDDQVISQISRIDESVEKLALINESLEQLKQQLGEDEEVKRGKLDEAKGKITSQIAILNEVKEHLTKLQGADGDADKVLSRVADKTKASSEKADQFVNDYNNDIKPTIEKTVKEVGEQLTSAKSMVNDIQSTIPKVEELLESTDGHLNEGQDVLQDILGEFPYVQDKVQQAADQIREIKDEASLSDIIELLKNNPEAERGFFEEPVLLNKNEIFPIENYGTGMTPFYTVLAVWVGALLLISLLSTDLPGEIRPQSMYFGRLFTFVTIGLLQTLIVTGGDMWLLGVTVEHPIWFIVFGFFISFIFMSIVYTVVSVFGDVGKALAIVLLVLQIAGAGGTYPVVLLPEFFQWINPFLPFTYAIDLMREAVGGIIWHQVWIDITSLTFFGLFFILLGVFLKGTSNQLMNKLMKSKDSRLFH